jgi:hypothetical protein
MNVIPILRAEFSKLGYAQDAIVSDYAFSDVFAENPSDRTVALAAFTRTPPSYRNAAFGVVTAKSDDPATLISAHRALGAPLFFLVSRENISVWQVRAKGSPLSIASDHPQNIASLFKQHGGKWKPGSIHRAKSIGQKIDRTYQLNFVDFGLLPVIEGQIHAKLDRLLADTLEDISAARSRPSTRTVDEHAVFRTIFRLLAAKLLQDRDHPLSRQWDEDDLETVLGTIRKHYRLPEFPGDRGRVRVFASGWDRLRRGISFRNISADDLAFVYENTLVTPETRKTFGTHSTPRQVAEFVVDRLQLSRISKNGDLRIYEPFAGAGVFLVAAMRQAKDLLPFDWTEEQRHNFLVTRIWGDEVDSFACEVARLSLILADYPNANGWKIMEADLFLNDTLMTRATGANVVLCNPPFQDFTPDERAKHSKAVARSHSKPIAALDAILDARPDALGFVLPPIFIEGKKYAKIRQRIEGLYRDIEIVDLPEHTFKASSLGSTLLIARERRDAKVTQVGTIIRSSGVVAKERDHFLATGEVSFSRSEIRPALSPNGTLWVGELDEIWQYLSAYPRFKSVANVHRGLEWKSRHQSKAISPIPRPGYVPGLGSAHEVFQYSYFKEWYLDTRPSYLKPNAISRPWSQPKLLANGVRRSRGMWNLCAVIDRKGLMASQQLIGIWPNEKNVALEVLCAILNGPIASAFSRDHSPGARLLVSAITDIPIPPTLPDTLSDKVHTYLAAINSHTSLFMTQSEHVSKLLDEIDAEVLKAYDLPPRLENTLLEQFRGSERPLMHEWSHWFPKNFQPFIPLHRFLSDEYKVATSGWVMDVFKPLPKSEADAVREYLE